MKREKRAGEKTLTQICELVDDLRQIDLLREIRTGVFYLGRNEIIHFHQLPDSIVADLFLPNERVRLPVNTRSEQLDVLDRIWCVVDKLER